jgi:hypothetical protein
VGDYTFDFNPDLQVQALPLARGRVCYVVDDALQRPQDLVALALDHRELFSGTGFNTYPGPQLGLPDGMAAKLDDFFRLRIRRLLDGRRSVRMHCRLAMVTLPEHELQPRQWICHRDSGDIAPEHQISASVLYLFKDATLGGTSFFVPRRSTEETEQLVRDSDTLGNAAFAQKYGLQPGYIRGSNAFFECIGTVAPKWNRMIFYDGRMFHSADLPAPHKLSNDPLTGRLTLNGFFTSTRRAV